jgi:hypothetical protein
VKRDPDELDGAGLTDMLADGGGPDAVDCGEPKAAVAGGTWLKDVPAEAAGLTVVDGAALTDALAGAATMATTSKLAMYRSPAASTSIPMGPARSELVAGPGVGAPTFPVPATTESVPDGVTSSTTLLP